MTATPPQTFLPVRSEEPAPEQAIRRVRAVRRSDWLALVGAAIAAVATTVLLTAVIAPIGGLIPDLVIGYVAFVGYYALLVSMDERPEVVRDRVAAVFVWTLGSMLFSVLGFVVGFALIRGHEALGYSNFFTQDMTMAGPLQGLDVGGIVHAVVGSLEQISMALAITIPLGLSCAVFLNEFPGGFARFVRTIVEAMTALPSIVAGLFIYATLILGFTIPGPGKTIHVQIPKSGLAASLAISVMMLPIIIRAADVVIRLVPASLREASYALGTSRWSTIWHVVLPTARSGLTTAVILGTARGIGETSPVLLTAGFNASLNTDPRKGPQVSLPLAIFEFVKSPQPAMVQRGFGTAAALMSIVLMLFVLARVLGGRGPGEVSGRLRRRSRRLSASDARRFAARSGAAAVVVGLVAMCVLRPTGPAYATESYVPISGAGSTWSQNALDQWRRNVNQYGMSVNYQGTGSSDGRKQFTNGTVDFAVSEIPYGLTDAGVYDSPPARKFAYMPIVAGGTSFMYNLTIGGQRVTNLRLSGDTISGIFTGRITMWNDPKVKKDNPLLALPPEKIVPVVRSDGSGTTAQFSTWMSKQHTSDWNSYCAQAGRPSPCGVTSFYPVVAGSPFVAQSGSLGVAGFVSQQQNEGTITYVEYSYALNTGFPVAKVLNKSGYYVEPTAQNVAVGLLKATIKPDLTQVLDGVYSNPDKRAYPLSSYSYMIIPTEATGSFTTDKGRTLGAFAYYFLCEGQQQAPILGYSPLPINLVKAGLTQVKRIPGADVQAIDISTCHNPTFSANGQNTLAVSAPYPQDCDAVGLTQCTTGTGGATKTPTPVSNQPSGQPTPTQGSTPGANQTPGPGKTTAGQNGQLPGAPLPGGVPVVDPETGVLVTPPGTVAGSTPMVTGQSLTLTSGSAGGSQGLLMVLAGLVLVLATVLPPVLARMLAARSR